MSGRALIVGEALIDEIVEGGETSRHPGGSPANVVLGLARLRVDARLHTALGSDADGALIDQHLRASGATVTASSVTGAPTSRALAERSPDGSVTYRFDIRWEPAGLEDLGSPTLVHTGSIGAFLAPGSKVTRDIVERGCGLGAVISFDPNVRPSLMPEPGRVRGSFEHWARTSHLIKMSDEDAEYLYPGRSTEDLLDDLIDQGVGVAVITLGSRGAALASGRARVRVPAIPTRVEDTIGAGDSFMAALIWALAFDDTTWDGHPLPVDRLQTIGETAALAAAMTVSRRGADLPTLPEVRARVDTVNSGAAKYTRQDSSSNAGR